MLSQSVCVDFIVLVVKNVINRDEEEKKRERGKTLKNKNPNLKSLLLNKNERFFNRPL